MRPRVVPDPQTSIYETTIENPELEAALEVRDRERVKARDAKAAYKTADERAKGLAEGLDLGNGAPVRVGRFVLTRHTVEATEVHYETSPSTRLTIRVLEQ